MMSVRICMLVVVFVCGGISQLSGRYVRGEAAEMQALVQQIRADRVLVDMLETEEHVRRRPEEVEKWAGQLGGMAPPQSHQILPEWRHAMVPTPKPRPKLPPSERPDGWTAEIVEVSL